MEDCQEPETTELVCRQYIGKRRVVMDGLETLGICEGAQNISEYVDS